MSLKDSPSSSGQKVGGTTPGAEHDDEPLLATLLIREAEAREIQQEGQGSGTEAEVTQKVAAGCARHGRTPVGGQIDQSIYG